MRKTLLFSFVFFTFHGLIAQCIIRYVTTNGSPTGSGTKTDPIDISTAFSTSGSGDIVRIASGTYTLSNPLTINANNVIFEGGFLPNDNWKKSSLVNTTVIHRNAQNPEGTANQTRLVAVQAVSKSDFEFHDLTITTENGLNSGMSTYAVHLDNCSSYSFVRCRIQAGNGGNGINGASGAAGSNGSAGGAGGSGSIDDQCAGGSGGTGGAGGGTGAGTSVAGGTNPGGCTQAGGSGLSGNTSNNVRAGGSGGSGGAGGEESSNGGPGGPGGGVNGGAAQSGGGAGGSWGNPGNAGGNGVAGANGANGIIGTVGQPGTVGQYFIPVQAGNGTDGTGGKGGVGGGGGGGQYCTFCIDGSGNGGGGGGGGGQGGQAGLGGFGGGGSFGIYLYNNGSNGQLIDCQITSSSAGMGGNGGAGGAGGAGGGIGLGGNVGTGEVGKGGNGGNGGTGGAGGAGGNGAPGTSDAVKFVSGTPLITSISTFALNTQPEIQVDYATCTNATLIFSAPSLTTIVQPWNFGLDANPSSSFSNPVITQFSQTGWKNVSVENNVYSAFVNISCQGFLDTVTTAICQGDSVVVGGNIYTAQGTYTDIFQSINTGCDSTVVTEITILQPTQSTLNETACGSYTLNGQTFNATGIYTQNLLNSAGCDSTITLVLTIVDLTATVTQNGENLSANESNASYQWLNCSLGFTPINGATDQNFTATSNGSYAVVITTDFCSDTSDCMTVEGLKVDEHEMDIHIYPNPFEASLHISSMALTSDCSVQVTDETGRSVPFSITWNNATELELVIPGKPGVYLVALSGNGKSRVIRAMKVE
jgi:hypothetical protein